MAEEEDRNLLRQSCMDEDGNVEENQIISLDWQQLAIKKINRFETHSWKPDYIKHPPSDWSQIIYQHSPISHRPSSSDEE